MNQAINQATQKTIHATAVAIGDHGVIIQGPSGSGKSDLALRIVDRGALLISDDQVIAKKDNDSIRLHAPTNIAGKMELYSLGIYEVPHVSDIELVMTVQLSDDAERYPMDQQLDILLGMNIPLIKLDGRLASAPIKVEMALQKIINAGRRS